MRCLVLSLALLVAAPAAASPAQEIRLGEDRAFVDWDDGWNREALVSDLDGDGLEDLILLSPDQPGAVMRGLGTGVFKRLNTDLPQQARCGALFDADGDGRDDVLVGKSQFGTSLYVGDGAGGFAETDVGLPPLGWVEGVASADVEGDGDLDVYLTYQLLTVLYEGLLLWNGTGYVAGGAAAPALEGQVATFADVDADGDPDLFVGTTAFIVPNSLLLNDSGSFTATSGALPAGGDETWDAAFGDVDADGDLDLISGNQFASALLLNDGNGGFTESAGLPPGLGGVRAVVLEDLDADGDLDLFAGTQVATPERVYANDGAGTLTEITDPLGGFGAAISSAAVADLDDDGDVDLVLGTRTGQAETLLGDGALAFGARLRKQGPSDPAIDVQAGDLDLDGDDDLLLIRDASITQEVHLNDGEGNFTKLAGAVPTPYQAANKLLLGDLDGDQDPDTLLLPDSFGTGEPVVFLTNQGDATFVDATDQIPADEGRATGGGLADADLDGDLDVLIAMDTPFYWLNDGAGVLTAAPASSITGGVPGGRVVFTDFDTDGVPELFTNDGYFENDGAGVLTQVSVPGPPTMSSRGDIAAADVDGDLDIDVVFVDFGVEEALYRNDGTGVFAEELLAHQVDAYRVVFEDLDGDLDADLVITANEGMAAFANDGGGAFTEVPGTFSGYGDNLTYEIVALDADGDGDRDLVTLGKLGIGGRLWTNRTRHAVQVGIAGLGKTAPVEVFGEPGALFVLGLATASTAVPLEPFGLLKLDPGSLVDAIPGTLDAGGRATYAASVPSTPVLEGVAIYWQAAVGAQLSFTNLDVAEVTAF